MTYFLGLKANRVRRAARGVAFMDARCRIEGVTGPTKRAPLKTAHADAYFLNLYYKEGETMPLDRWLFKTNT